MAFKPKFENTAAPIDPIPSGQYDARCYGVAELGHKVRFNKFKNCEESVNELMLFFEIPELPVTFELEGKEVTKPRATYPRFKVSMHEKAKLRQFIEAWFGKKFKSDDEAYHFDFSKLIGYCASLSMEVTEREGKQYSNIVTISPLHKSVKLEPQHNPSINFGIEDINSPAFNDLYPWVKKRIMESEEYEQLAAKDEPGIDVVHEDIDESSIPF